MTGRTLFAASLIIGSVVLVSARPNDSHLQSNQ